MINPSGGKGIYGKVHFKNFAIGIVALDDELNTYLVGQYRFTLNEYSWEIPEGGGPIGIDILESAKRELKEYCVWLSVVLWVVKWPVPSLPEPFHTEVACLFIIVFFMC